MQALGGWSILLVPSVVLLAAVALGAFVFLRSQALMEGRLRTELTSAAAIAALQFDASDVEAVRSADDMKSAAYRSLVEGLRKTRDSLPDARFAYLMRRTDDPDVVAFVADADGLSTPEELDVNRNGEVDEDEKPGLPGEPYDVSQAPALGDEAFARPVTDSEITVDAWGRLISAYAPVKDADGNTVAVVGIDMDAGEFYALTRGIFSPVAYILVILAGLGIALYVGNAFRVRRIEQLQQMDAERTAMMDLASHQLGAPLATFKWWLEILRDEPGEKTKEKNDAFDEMQRGIVRMDAVVQSLRSASRINQGDFGYVARSVSVAGLVRDAAKAASPALAVRGQALSVDVAEGLPTVSADDKLLRGAFEELIENAGIYSSDGSPVAVRATASRGGVTVEVEDRGCGIPAADQPHVFERFRRGSNAHLRKPVGNGLGLSIAKSIVERARGTLTFQSREGEGTVFSLWLPGEKKA